MRLIPILLIAISLIGCVTPSGSDYGLLRIQAPNGEEFYFRREMRGRNYDSLALSKDSDPCTQPDPDHAVIWRGMGPSITFYRFEGNELHLYEMEDLVIPPNFSKTIKVIIHQITNPQYNALRESYAEKGLAISDVPLNSKQICWN